LRHYPGLLLFDMNRIWIHYHLFAQWANLWLSVRARICIHSIIYPSVRAFICSNSYRIINVKYQLGVNLINLSRLKLFRYEIKENIFTHRCYCFNHNFSVLFNWLHKM
jgi:hypothetical protein